MCAAKRPQKPTFIYPGNRGAVSFWVSPTDEGERGVWLDHLPLGTIHCDRGWNWAVGLTSALYCEGRRPTLTPALTLMPMLIPLMDLDALREARKDAEANNFNFNLDGLRLQVDAGQLPPVWGLYPPVGHMAHVGRGLIQSKWKDFKTKKDSDEKLRWIQQELQRFPWLLQFSPLYEALRKRMPGRPTDGRPADEADDVLQALRRFREDRPKGRPAVRPAIRVQDLLARVEPLPDLSLRRHASGGIRDSVSLVADMFAADASASASGGDESSELVETVDRSANRLDKCLRDNQIGPACFPFIKDARPLHVADRRAFLLDWVHSPVVGRRILLFTRDGLDEFQPLEASWAPPWPPQPA